MRWRERRLKTSMECGFASMVQRLKNGVAEICQQHDRALLGVLTFIQVLTVKGCTPDQGRESAQ